MSKIFTVKEVAKILRLSINAVGMKLRSGELKGKQIGQKWRVLQEDLEKYLGCTDLKKYLDEDKEGK